MKLKTIKKWLKENGLGLLFGLSIASMLFWVITMREYSPQPLTNVEVIVIGWAMIALFLLAFQLGSINQKLEIIHQQMWNPENKRWQKKYAYETRWRDTGR